MLKAYDAGRIFGERTGAGAPWVLALHGWGRSRRDFDSVLAASAAPGDAAGPATATGPVDAVALDLPGFGSTPAPPEGWGSADYARAVVPVLAEMVEEAGRPAVLLGHSFGGRVAVHLAAGWPDLVGALVLTGAPLARVGTGARPPSRPFRVGRALHRRGLIGKQAMERLRRRYGSADYRAATGVMRDVLVRLVNEGYEAELAALAGPVELVWGAEDAEVPLSVGEALSAALDGRARLTVCPGVGHLTPVEAPETLRQAVERHRDR
ncbi:MAG: alpha/beta fold hydrolase [Acidimicrobiales bacterium]